MPEAAGAALGAAAAGAAAAVPDTVNICPIRLEFGFVLCESSLGIRSAI